MNSLKLKKFFIKLTIMSFTLITICMIIVFMLDVVFNIKINAQYILIGGKFIFGYIVFVVIFWGIFNTVDGVRESLQYINENKEEIIETGEEFLEISNDIKNDYTGLKKNDKFLVTAFIIWFIVSVVLMFWFQGNSKIEIILFSQYVIVMILAIILGRRK